MLAPLATRPHSATNRCQSRPAKRSPRRMFFEPLEDRRLLTIYAISGDADDGVYRDDPLQPYTRYIHIGRDPSQTDLHDSVIASYHLFGDAAPGVDYSATDGTITIPAGQRVYDIPFHALKGQYRGPDARELLIDVE